jgi:hypothetical protein
MDTLEQAARLGSMLAPPRGEFVRRASFPRATDLAALAKRAKPLPGDAAALRRLLGRAPTTCERRAFTAAYRDQLAVYLGQAAS